MPQLSGPKAQTFFSVLRRPSTVTGPLGFCSASTQEKSKGDPIAPELSPRDQCSRMSPSRKPAFSASELWSIFSTATPSWSSFELSVSCCEMDGDCPRAAGTNENARRKEREKKRVKVHSFNRMSPRTRLGYP